MLRPFLIVCALVATGAAVQAQPIAIRAERLVDPEGGTSAPNQAILIEGGLITAVGANVSIPRNARLIGDRPFQARQ